MSADLFAEFGAASQGSQQQHQGPGGNKPAAAAATPAAAAAADPFSFFNLASSQAPQQPPASQQWMPSLSTQPTQPSTGNFGDLWGSGTGGQSGAGGAVTEEDDDTWGDFEVAAVTRESPKREPAPRPIQAAPNRSAPPRTRIIRASTMDLMTNNLVDFGASSRPSTLAPSREQPSTAKPRQRPQPPAAPKNTDPDVLFDADDFDPDHPPVEEEDEDDDDEDDDFGDFETVAPPVTKAPQKPAAPPSMDILSLDWSSPPTAAPPPATATAQSRARKEPPSQLLSTLNLGDSSLYPQPPRSPSYQERNPFPGLAVTTPKATEFPTEEKPTSESPVTAWPAMDEQQPPPAAKSITTTTTTSFADDWAAFDDAPASKQQQKNNGQKSNAAPPTGWDWDVVDSAKPAQPAVAAAAATAAAPKPSAAASQSKKSPEEALDWSWDAVDAEQPQAEAPLAAPIPDTAPPPTNVPPPSILLSIFPSLFDVISTALFQPTAGQPSTVKNRILSDPKTIKFLGGYLLLATVAARIMAGRKLRWHRDKFLAQGMAISAAGGKGGMKLAGVDKAQAAREDREAADVLSAWRQHVGRLRGTVATAKAAAATAPDAGEHYHHQPLMIPELSENMVVQPAKMVPTAPKACIICGLKRDERIKGVDVDVEDSFGEWWVDHWGHRACRNFWLEHEVKLRSR